MLIKEIRGIEFLSIYNYTHEDGPGVWDNIFRSLRDGITKEGMLQLISLACHIQDHEGKPLMKEKSSNHRTQILTNGTHLIRARTRLAQVQVQKSTGVSQSCGEGKEDAKLKFKAVCYFAACLMRLVTKPPDNFMRSLARIKDQFFKLNIDDPRYLNSLKFEGPMAEHISLAFRLFPVFKHTIAHHVAVADLEHRGKWDPGLYGILRFACIQHLEFHGMNVYPPFIELINRLKYMSRALYHSWLRCPANNSALDTIRDIVLKYDHREGCSTRFFVYARIFDRGYFWQLEPKSCKYLMAIQAYLTIKYLHHNSEGSDSPLNIPVIKNDHAVLSSAKQIADEFIRAYKILRAHLDKLTFVERVLNEIPKEMAEEYVRTHDILSVHLDEAGFIWKIINTSKTDNQVESDIKRPRIAGGPSNTFL